jgi:hypothetical protein
MGRLDILRTETSSDIQTARLHIIKNDLPDTKTFAEESRQKSGPVKSKLLLTEFELWDKTKVKHSTPPPPKAKPKIIISKYMIFSASLAKLIDKTKTYEFLTNKRGNIIIMRESEKGFLLRNCYRGTLRLGFKQFAEIIRERNPGIKYIHFIMEWDEGLNAWVGKAEQKAVN